MIGQDGGLALMSAVMNGPTPIMVWAFEDAPPQVRNMADGDGVAWSWAALVPPNYSEAVPSILQSTIGRVIRFGPGLLLLGE